MNDIIAPTKDIKRSWLNPLRRIQSVAGSKGYNVIQITTLVHNGDPVVWFDPIVKKIEPLNSNAVQRMVEEIGKEEALKVITTMINAC